MFGSAARASGSSSAIFSSHSGAHSTVLLLFFQIQQHQRILAKPVVREGQRPVVGFRLQPQRRRRGGTPDAGYSAGTPRRSSWISGRNCFLLNSVKARQIVEFDRFAMIAYEVAISICCS
ncbi:hypothetical protein LNO81_21720 [Klebsiella variicola subsp. variicola]|nr:hypothetical protein [Klebsiella variicola subsp. variicola]